MPNFSETAPLVDVACPLGHPGPCREIVDTVWEADQAKVYQCPECEIVFVHPIMSEEEERAFYEAEFSAYMGQRGEKIGAGPAEHFKNFEGEGRRRLRNLEPFLRPGMKVLELGSSTGYLLDALRPHVGSVTGIEPEVANREHAESIGIEMFGHLDEVKDRRFDLILAYYVVEHLRDPVGYLHTLYEMLEPGGRLAIEVPNVDDALVRYYQLDAFDRFYWQKAHYFNYSHRTLTDVLERAGFETVEAIPEQRYDISNHIHWLWQGKPGGKGRYTDLLDERVNAEYQRVLRESWHCDTVFAVATKSG
jgi:2-polyprenyl-3-methyl-5-hydroxy-6-metoxy-1,4-benzoquinol methylase